MNEARVTPISNLTAGPLVGPVRAEISPGQTFRPSRAITTVETLYGGQERISSDLRNVLRLLNIAMQLTEDAHQAAQEHDFISADDAIQRLMPRLSELFAHRQLGDGFAAVVDALSCALENLGSRVVAGEQVEAIREVLRMLRTEPFLRFDRAIEIIDILESVNLSVDPQAAEVLTDWLDSEGIR